MAKQMRQITITFEEDGQITERHIDPSGVGAVIIDPELTGRLGEFIDVEPGVCEAVGGEHPGEMPHDFGNPRISWGLCVYDPETGRIICIAHPAMRA